MILGDFNIEAENKVMKYFLYEHTFYDETEYMKQYDETEYMF